MYNEDFLKNDINATVRGIRHRETDGVRRQSRDSEKRGRETEIFSGSGSTLIFVCFPFCLEATNPTQACSRHTHIRPSPMQLDVSDRLSCSKLWQSKFKQVCLFSKEPD